jgi:nucleoside-diphosphate-sugar epimerase
MAVAVVTGAAGFIGSHLCAALLAEGHQVRGIDNFDPYYDRRLKESNLADLRRHPAFTFVEADLVEADLAGLLDGADRVFHQAARAGVRSSWGADFRAYVHANVTATQRLLEALRARPAVRAVFASSSSVYGEAARGPTPEDAPRRPVSPYGVTKLAGEALAAAYHANFGLPVVGLRYFTVFGPRQRPDMAFHRFARAITLGRPFEVYGDGRQVRDFTYVTDAVAANLLAIGRGQPGEVYNIGGGAPASVLDAIGILTGLAGRKAQIVWGPRQPGDPRATEADTTRAREVLGFRPRVGLTEGLGEMMAWMASILRDGPDERGAQGRP